MKTVLFPTDFSENAAHALNLALKFVDDRDGRLVLMHSCDLPYDFASRAEEILEANRSYSKQQLGELENTIRKNSTYQSMNVETVTRCGSSVFTILEVAEDFEADLIMMGTKGISGLKHMLFGSVTTRVIKEADIPVMAIPSEASTEAIDEIVFPTDYRDDDLTMLADIITLADSFDAKVTILHIAETEHLKEEIMYRGFSSYLREKVHFSNIEHKLTYNPNMFDALDNYTKDVKNIVLAIGDYHGIFIDQLTGLNIKKWLDAHDSMPLLVLKAN